MERVIRSVVERVGRGSWLGVPTWHASRLHLAMSRSALYVRLLGEPEMESSAGSHVFLGDKRYLLLAYLACHRDWVDRARLARLFWPEHEFSAARHNLRQLLKRLKSLDCPVAVESSTGQHAQRVRWLPATDLTEIDSALTEGRWSVVLALHRGPLLAGMGAGVNTRFDTWLSEQRAALEDRVRRELMIQGAVRAGANDHTAAAAIFGHLLAAEPFDEEALRAYMEACVSDGQPAKAMSAYQKFAEHVKQEFDLIPASTTEALAQRIRTGGTRVDVKTSRADQAEPTLPIGSLLGVGRLIGRELELADIQRLLADPHCRLVTITGPGGVGKSALARRAAHELRAEFADGCEYVPLDGASRSVGVLGAITAHLTRPSIADITADPATIIGKRHLLLVLDDLDAFQSSAQRLQELLQRCPNLKILTTTRERLAVSEEWVLPLEGLPTPMAGASPLEVMASDAVQLFITHARRLRPDYYLPEDEAPAVARICRLVAGLPLALELCAVWTRVLPVPDIADELAKGLDLVAVVPPGSSHRHSSMRECIQCSWRNLSDGERRSWRALAVFAGPFDRTAAAHVAGVALPQLAALVDKSILRSVPVARFSFHPLLRAFGVERLADGATERYELGEAHANHFLSAIVEAHEQAGAARRAATDNVAASLDDVAAAWRWAVAALLDTVSVRRAPPPVTVGRWCIALSAVCERKAWHLMASELFTESSRELQRSDGPTDLLGTVMAQLGWHRLRLGESAAAASLATTALELLAGHGPSAAWRTALSTRAAVAMQGGKHGEAQTCLRMAIESLSSLGTAGTRSERSELASLTGNLGLAKQLAGERREAALDYQDQLGLLRGTDDTAGVAIALSNLGNVLRLLDRFEEALALLEEGLRLADEDQLDTVKPALHINLGVLHLQMGAPDAAQQHFERAARLARDRGRRAMVAMAMNQLGRLELTHGTVAAAKSHFEEACALAVQGGSPSAILDALAGLAWVAWRTDATARAVTLAQVVREHLATSPGTRTWAVELVDLMESTESVTDPPSATSTLDEAVTKALRLVADVAP